MGAEILPPGEVGGNMLVIEVEGVASTDNAALGSVANPEGADLLITRGIWHIETPSTGAANVSIGVTTEAAAATDLINALAANGEITGKSYNCHARQNTAKTEISVPAKWEAGKFITFTGSGATTDLKAYLLIEYVKLP